MTKQEKIELLENAPPMRAVFRMALPTVLSQVVSLVYNLADTFFVGRLHDPKQLAALSLCFPIFMISVLVANFFGIGANSLISRALGRGDYDEVKRLSSFSVYGSGIAAIMIALAGTVFVRPLLYLLGAQPDTIEYAYQYLKYVFLLGLLPNVLSLTLSHLLRAEGASRQSGVGLALGGILNIILDPIFIFLSGRGVVGAAIATLVSNIVAMAYFLVVMLRSRKSSFLCMRPMKIRPRLAGQVCLAGLPSALVILFGTLANFYMLFVCAAYDDTVIAAYGILQKFSGISIHLGNGMSQGVSPLLGYSYAHRNADRTRQVSLIGFLTIIMLAAVIVVLIELFPVSLAGLFASDQATIESTTLFLRCSIPGALFAAAFLFFNASVVAFGKWKQGVVLNIMRQAVFFVPTIYMLNRLFGITGLAVSYFVSEVLNFLVCGAIYLTVFRRIMRSLS